MKSLLKMTLIGSAIVLALTGCDDKKDSTPVATQQLEQSAAANDTTNTVTSTTEIESKERAFKANADESYAIGSSFAQHLQDSIKTGNLSLNNADVIKGFDDASNNETKYTKDDIQMTLVALDTRLQDAAKENAAKEKTESAEGAKENADKSASVQVVDAKEAYSLGASFGFFLQDNLKRADVSADNGAIIEGFNEEYNGQSKFTKEETQTILTNFDKRLREEAEQRFEAEKAENIRAGDAYRNAFAAEAGVKKTDSGLLYKIIDEGKKPNPTADDTVVVHYKGTLVDGKQFDSSYDRGEPTKFPLKGVIKGWTEGIPLVGVGGKIKLVVPPELAYGDQNIPGIAPGSTLVFDVELLSIDNDDANQSKPE